MITMKFKKGFSMGDIPAAVIILVIIGTMAVIGTSINDSMVAADTNNHFTAALNNSSLGMLEITSNLQLLGLIIIMGAIITILLASFGGFMRGGGL